MREKRWKSRYFTDWERKHKGNRKFRRHCRYPECQGFIRQYRLDTGKPRRSKEYRRNLRCHRIRRQHGTSFPFWRPAHCRYTYKWICRRFLLFFPCRQLGIHQASSACTGRRIQGNLWKQKIWDLDGTSRHGLWDSRQSHQSLVFHRLLTSITQTAPDLVGAFSLSFSNIF